MNLLTGIIGSQPGILLSPTSSVTTSSTGSSSMSITGANAGNIYILIHSVLKGNNDAVSISSPSGFSGDGGQAFPGRLAYHISYKYLTSNENTITIPSVTNAQAQCAIGFVINSTNGLVTSLSNPNNQFLYLASGDPSAVSSSVNPNDIPIGSYSVVNDDGSLAFDGSLVINPNLSNSIFVTSASTGERLHLLSYLKLFADPDTASIDPYSENVPSFTSVSVVRPSR
jgi:hypothetical protein